MSWDQIKSKRMRVSARIKAAWDKLNGHDSGATEAKSKLEPLPIPIGEKR